MSKETKEIKEESKSISRCHVCDKRYVDTDGGALISCKEGDRDYDLCNLHYTAMLNLLSTMVYDTIQEKFKKENDKNL